jgi:hypothetical protein
MLSWCSNLNVMTEDERAVCFLNNFNFELRTKFFNLCSISILMLENVRNLDLLSCNEEKTSTIPRPIRCSVQTENIVLIFGNSHLYAWHFDIQCFRK